MANKSNNKKVVSLKLNRDQIHAWLNSLGVIGALIVAAYSAVLSRDAMLLKKESLGFDIRPTNGCELQSRPIDTAVELGLCWSVTITNESENRLSLISHEVFSFDREGGQTYISGFREIEDLAGHDVNFPVMLDGGEAKALTIRVPFLVRDRKIAALVEKFMKGRKTPASLGDLQNYLAEQGIDAAGNNLKIMRVDGKILGWSIEGEAKHLDGIIHLKTGRKAFMTAKMSYPPRMEAGKGY